MSSFLWLARTLLHGLIGGIAGAFTSVLIGVMIVSDDNQEERTKLAYTILAGGFVLGAIIGATLGMARITGTAKGLILGAVSGVLVGIVASVAIGRIWPAYEEKEVALHTFAALIFAVPIGGLIGSIIGLWFMRASPPGD